MKGHKAHTGKSSHHAGRHLKHKLGGGIMGEHAATHTGGHKAPTEAGGNPKVFAEAEKHKGGGAIHGGNAKKRLDRHGGHIGRKASGGGADLHPYSSAAHSKGGRCG
jgi:hypothetical protein